MTHGWDARYRVYAIDSMDTLTLGRPNGTNITTLNS